MKTHTPFRILLLSFALLISMASIAQDKKQCQGKTKAGIQCRHQTDSAAYCNLHNPALPRCGVITKAGTACKMAVKAVGIKCHHHKFNQ